MGDRVFTSLTIRISFKLFPESLMSAYMRDNAPFICSQISPYQGNIFPLHGMIKELFCQAGYRIRSFGEYHQATRVLVDPVNKTKSWQNGFVDLLIFLLEVVGNPIDQGTGIIS